MSTLGVFSRNANPENVRLCLDAYYSLLDTCNVVRQQMQTDGTPLSERIAAAGVQQDIEGAIRKAHTWLSNYARRGRGTFAASRGAQGAAGGARDLARAIAVHMAGDALESDEGASMAHGCAVLDLAVGTAPAAFQGGADAHSDDAFSLGPEWQELPARQSVGHAGTTQEAVTRV